MGVDTVDVRPRRRPAEARAWFFCATAASMAMRRALRAGEVAETCGVESGRQGFKGVEGGGESGGGVGGDGRGRNRSGWA